MNGRRYRQRSGSAGFTLVEVLLVVAILGILAAVVVVRVGHQQTPAMIKATRASIAALSTAIELYEVQMGHLPATFDALVNNDGSPAWNGPYFKGANPPVDAWGTPFSYSLQNERDYKIISAGPDKNMGNGDDITSF